MPIERNDYVCFESFYIMHFYICNALNYVLLNSFIYYFILFYYLRKPITSTSQSTPFGSSLTATQLLAGFSVKNSS